MGPTAGFEVVNADLYTRLPACQIKRVMGSWMCDIEPEFLGFVHIYKALSEIIPLHFTVVDLGCAYAPQAFLFDQHTSYVGVDMMVGERFAAHNTKHHIVRIGDFLKEHGPSFDKKTTFGICSYVPPWDGDNRKLARDFFTNVFTFYPSRGPMEGARPIRKAVCGE